MSFILDALKKSESERHRQSGPVLMDVRIAPPRRRIPPWAWVIAAVLLVNLAVLTWVLWLSPSHQTETAPMVAAAAPAPVAAPVAAPATPAAAPDPAVAQPVTPIAAQTADPSVQFTAPQPVQNPPAQGVIGASQNIDVATLPKVADIVASGMALPELQLSWHVYDAAPQSRYVLLNGARLREGDFTADGVRVVQIAPTGVVVEWRGRRMFLNAGH
jgi:general secretion pathway protein B